MSKTRIGHGFDVHRLTAGRRLVIGGVTIEWHLGLHGHSDADVLLHAVCDACLGAAGLGDIGRHFPPSDPAYEGADSRGLLRRVRRMLDARGWSAANLDCTVIAERPPLSPHTARMEANIAADLGLAAAQVNVKATTTEGLGFCGREEGIAAMAVVLLECPDSHQLQD
ncbi:MAG: 2-C-methyl-D-erythritol 2,4-cyclodiphosphate synthase [Gammaproteobacteria bacterium]|nr:2-C-methyl-D-erythritol 2,4-cyclodiphosphate synthase [Gammaproteobacteria bacterium]